MEESDPRLIEAYKIARQAEDSFENTLQSVGRKPIPGEQRKIESVRRISMYVGTLFGEVLAASMQLGVLEMPRAQYILNRQLIEYYGRNRWFLEHADAALMEMDTLPKTVWREVQSNRSAFNDPAFVDQIEQNYKTWAREHPDLDAKEHKVPGFTEMVRLALDSPDDMLWYYGHPSIIVHARTHGIQDVLKITPDGSVERSPNSLQLDRVLEMHRATGFAIQYATLLAMNFDLPTSDLSALNDSFGEILVVDGVTPKPVTVKKYL